MKLDKTFFLFLLLWSAVPAAAQQDANSIKTNPDVYWAEGHGATFDDASRNAKKALVEKIRTIVSASTSRESNLTQRNGAYDYTQQTESSVKSFSFMSLRNVETLLLKEEPDAIVLMWMEKSEVQAITKEREKKIRDFVETGKDAEKRLQLDDALRNYYWAFMLAKANGEAVYANFNGEQRNCLAFLPSKISSIISQTDVSLESCINKGNRYYAQLHFKYHGRDVSSVQIRYFDGQSYVGPLSIRDGLGEIELVQPPVDGKIKLRYEYSFRDEAEHIDTELSAVFSELGTIPMPNTNAEIPVKIDEKKQSLAAVKKSSAKAISTTDNISVSPELSETYKQKEFDKVDDCTPFLSVLKSVEKAISIKDPSAAYDCFTPEGYKMFEQLINATGHVALVGKNQDYQFIKANNQIWARSCRVKLTFSNGKAFMENVVFRFDPSTEKILSFAFTLTKKAESDIFNAASQWPDISRFTIVQFMEDYQTAYALKRDDYIEKIFSDDALIICGTMLKVAPKKVIEGETIDLERKDVKYTIQNKRQYMQRLRALFKSRDYIHLTFENNTTRVFNAPRLPKATAFAIQINQLYSSPAYSDKGYLTLVLDASQELPIIHVRLWQPDTDNFIDIEEFMNNFKF